MNGIARFDTKAFNMESLQTSGQIPSPRLSHGGAAVGKVLFIFGVQVKVLVTI